MTHGLLSELSRWDAGPSGSLTVPPVGGGRPWSARRRWLVAAVFVVLVVTVVLGVREIHAAREAAAARAAVLSARADVAWTWVWLLSARRDGFMATAVACDAMMDRYAASSGTALLEHFDRSLGGVLVEATPDHVDGEDGAYYVRFDGELDSGDPVTFTVRVISQDGDWRACGLGGPDQYS